MNFLKKIPLKAWAVLSVFCAIYLISYFRALSILELQSYDLMMKLRPPFKASSDIALIEIDDTDLKNLGKYPLPRDYHASLTKVLREYGVRQIVFDIVFSEQTLYDEMFAASCKEAGNVYLGNVFYLEEDKLKGSLIPVSQKVLAEVTGVLEKSAKGIGYINTIADLDGKIRKIPLFIKYEGRLYAQLAVKAACDWLGLDINNIEAGKDRLIIDKKLTLPSSPHSYFLVNYPGTWKNSFLHFSYVQIIKAYNDINKGIQPGLDLSRLKNKTCFIGLTASGSSDLRANPLEHNYPMLGLQASVFNGIIQKRFLRDAGPLFNTLINLLIFCFMLVICWRLVPLKALVASIALGTGYFGLAFGLFVFWGIWLDLFLPLLIIGSTYVTAMFYKFIEEVRKRQILEKELDIAHQIQESFLPSQINKFCGWEISSFMQPAKFVAGDLYDIVPLDDKRLGIIIGDVAGKGVSASLIMAQTISLFRVFAYQYSDCMYVLKRLNKELYGKFGGRFVTALYMIMDTENNKIYAASAGHGPLLVVDRAKNSVYEAPLAVDLPLGIMEDTGYKDIAVDIKHGDKVAIFSDGLLEARNKQGQEFGLENIKRIISEKAGYSSQDILASLKDEVSIFSRHCPQHDDITMIIVSCG